LSTSVILFDLIYTLLHLDMEKFGLKVSMQFSASNEEIEASDFLDSFKRNWISYTDGEKISKKEFYENVLGEVDISYSRDKAETVKNAFLDSFHIYDDADLLKELAERYRLGIITNGSEALTTPLIKKFGFEEYFEVVINSREAGCRKPCKEIYTAVLNGFKVQPEEILFISDEYEEDLLTAKEMGMKVCLIDRSGVVELEDAFKDLNEVEELKSLGRLIIKDLNELKKVIK